MKRNCGAFSLIKSQTSVPRFTRKVISEMRDQLLTMNLDKECLVSTGSVHEKRERLIEHFYPTTLNDDTAGTTLHFAAVERTAPLSYTIDNVKGVMVEQLRNVSHLLGLPILNDETNQKWSKPILRDKLIAFIQAQDPNTNFDENLNENSDSSQNILEDDVVPWFLNLPRTGGVIKKIPKASREHHSRTCCELLERVTVVGDKKSWEQPRAFLANPKRGSKKNYITCHRHKQKVGPVQ